MRVVLPMEYPAAPPLTGATMPAMPLPEAPEAEAVAEAALAAEPETEALRCVSWYSL